MDRIQELLSGLADLADANVAELEGLILSEFDAAESEEPTSETVERMVSLADALDEVRGEVRRRNELAQALSEKAAAAAQRVRGNANEASMKEEDEEEVAEDAQDVADEAEDVAAEVEEIVAEDEDDDEEDEEEKAVFSDSSESVAQTDTAPAPEAELSATPEPEPEPTPTPTPTQELSADAPAVEETPTPQEDAVTASSNDGSGVVVTPPADAVPTQTANPASALSLTITAGADIPGYGTGSTLSSMDDVATAFAKRLHTLRNVQGGDGAQHTVATLSFEFPEDRRLSGDEPSNFSKVNKVVGQQALTAAAGICAPLEPIYDINVCGDDDRPIRDALARFNADRGGVKVWPTPTLSGGVGLWDPKAPTAKSCADATCPTPAEIMVDAVYACLRFNNFTNRFFPEVVKANTDLALINHAREAELNLLKQIATAGTKVSATDKKVGITRQVLFVLQNASALLRRKHRLTNDSPMRALVPSWVKDAMVADLALQMPGDGLESLGISEARINGLLRDAGINVTWTLEGLNKAGAAEAVPTGTDGFDAEVAFALFPEGTFLFLDGGTLDLGVQRDASMLASNEYATFVETFEGIAKTGCESLWIDTPVCVSGAASALAAVPC